MHTICNSCGTQEGGSSVGQKPHGIPKWWKVGRLGSTEESRAQNTWGEHPRARGQGVLVPGMNQAWGQQDHGIPRAEERSWEGAIEKLHLDEPARPIPAQLPSLWPNKPEQWVGIVGSESGTCAAVSSDTLGRPHLTTHHWGTLTRWLSQTSPGGQNQERETGILKAKLSRKTKNAGASEENHLYETETSDFTNRRPRTPGNRLQRVRTNRKTLKQY